MNRSDSTSRRHAAIHAAAFVSLSLATLMAVPWPRSSDDTAAQVGTKGAASTTEAIASLLASDPAAFKRLVPVFADAPPALRRALIDAAARTDSPRALPFLEHALVNAPLLRLATLSSVGRIGARCHAPIGEAATECLASLLGDVTGDRRILHAACLAAGNVQAHATVPALVDLLAHGDGLIRHAAHRALCRVTGLAFPNDAERWLVWLRDEATWLRDERPRVAAALASEDLGAVTRALDEAVAHRYRRDTIAADVAQALDHPSRTVRLRACTVLGQLGGRAVPAHVVHLLGTDDAQLAASARAVIIGIVGREIPATPNACRADLGLDRR